MPLITESGYRYRPWYFPSSHLETIIPSLLNVVSGVNYQRERLELVDGDFLDLDWLKNDNQQLIILSHGMEGSTQRHYMLRAAKYFHERDWDILGWNNRGCSGELNRLAKSYHHGVTSDLDEVVTHSLSKGKYKQVVLIGISMGGCQTIKYLGNTAVDDRVLGAFNVSVSFNLEDTSVAAEKNLNGFYGKRFLTKLKDHYKRKAEGHEELKGIDLDAIVSFDELHEQVTTRLFGFESKNDFYKEASCGNYLESIDRPVYVLNAKNDPLLGPNCYPETEIEENAFVYVEYPKYGGHVGFTIPAKPYSYIELCAEKFIDEVILSR